MIKDQMCVAHRKTVYDKCSAIGRAFLLELESFEDETNDDGTE